MAKTAVDAQRLNAFSIEPDRLTIVSDKSSALYDERIDKPIDERMVLNIMAFGVKQAVIVRKNGSDIYEVVDGRQRVRCAIEANKRLKKEGKEEIRVPIMLTRGDDKDVFGVSIFCNEIRSDDAIMVKAKKVQRLLNMGKSPDEAAITFGVTKAAINQWLALLDLAPQVQKAVEEGEVSASAAAPLAKLTREDQVVKLAELRASGEKMTSKKVGTAVRAAKGQEANERPSLSLLQRIYNAEVLNDNDHTFLGWIIGEKSAKQAEMGSVLSDLEIADKEARRAKAEKKAPKAKKAKAAAG